MLIDSTGLKVYGAGEWLAGKQASGRAVTGASDIASQVEPLLEQIHGEGWTGHR